MQKYTTQSPTTPRFFQRSSTLIKKSFESTKSLAFNKIGRNPMKRRGPSQLISTQTTSRLFGNFCCFPQPLVHYHKLHTMGINIITRELNYTFKILRFRHCVGSNPLRELLIFSLPPIKCWHFIGKCQYFVGECCYFVGQRWYIVEECWYFVGKFWVFLANTCTLFRS